MRRSPGCLQLLTGAGAQKLPIRKLLPVLKLNLSKLQAPVGDHPHGLMLRTGRVQDTVECQREVEPSWRAGAFGDSCLLSL